MVAEPIHCPECNAHIAVIKHGLTLDGKQVGKGNTQLCRIKQLARKKICFSKSKQMHDIVIGLFINRQEFG